MQDVEYGNTAQLGDCHGKAQSLLLICSSLWPHLTVDVKFVMSFSVT